MLRAIVLKQYMRVTDGRPDGQTDGIAVAGTALAMRALRRAVKIEKSPHLSSGSTDLHENWYGYAYLLRPTCRPLKFVFSRLLQDGAGSRLHLLHSFIQVVTSIVQWK